MRDTDGIVRSHIEKYLGVGSLSLSGFDMESLPKLPLIDGNLYLNDCRYLKELPDNIVVTGSLYMNNCESLISLPKIGDEMTVLGGNLNLSGCTSLQSLPEDLTVSGCLYMLRCLSLGPLPPSLRVGGDVLMGNLPHLLDHIPNIVYSDISFLYNRQTIVAYPTEDQIIWAAENDMEIAEKVFDIKPFPVECLTIANPAQLMHYRLKWG